MNKHIELLKKIPCGNFGISKLFFDKFKRMPQKNITNTDILMAYYYISVEMMDSIDSRYFIVRRNPKPYNEYDCHDPLTNAQTPITTYKKSKLYNGVIKQYCNRTPHAKHYGLVAKPKQENIDSDIEDFKIFAEIYKSRYCQMNFTGEHIYNIGKKELNHLYTLLKTLDDKADFYYEQPGSIILAQEMASVMINHNIILDNQHTRNGAEFVRKHKLFMFGELQR